MGAPLPGSAPQAAEVAFLAIAGNEVAECTHRQCLRRKAAEAAACTHDFAARTMTHARTRNEI